MARIEQLSVYLLKPTVATGTDALRDNASYTEVTLPANAPPDSVLLTRSTPPHPPTWIRFFPKATQQAISGILAASAGAVLLLPVRGRWFAVCFGTGWHLLRKDSFVRSFGMKAALSVVKIDTLKSVDVSTYENFAKHRRVSTSKGTTIDSFDIEGQLDLLRGVFGDCGLQAIAVHIGGKDACVVWTRVTFDRLHKLCGALLRLYESTRLSKRFPLLNNVTEVRDPSEVQRLDGLLDAQLVMNATHDVSIAPPDVVDWQNVSAFTLDHGSAPAPSISLSFTDVRTMYKPNMPTCGDMKSVNVETQTPAGIQGPQGWTLYDCLVTEIDDPTKPSVRCILMAGTWYEVAASFVAHVNQELLAIPAHAQALPDALAAETEDAYNSRFAQTDPVTLTLLDRRTISYGGGRSRIEVCDVLSAASRLYHIKDYHGSATLSHLFAQGTVSARLLLEQEFRQELLNKYPGLPGNVIQVATPPAAVEVVFGIICESGRALPAGLPFFSKVRLVESARELKRMGYPQVTVARISRP